jgi:hypothetical protein
MLFDSIDAPNPIPSSHPAVAGGSLAAAGPPALVEVARRGSILAVFRDRETGLVARADLSAVLTGLDEAGRRELADLFEEAVEAALQAEGPGAAAPGRLDGALANALRAPALGDHRAAIAAALGLGGRHDA